MKIAKFFILLSALFLVGCDTNTGGAVGDQNDPSTSGSDEEQMNEEEGDVEASNDEE